MSNLAWFVYNILRYKLGTVVGYLTLSDFLTGKVVIAGQVVFPLIMMGVFWLSGYYNEVLRKSRLQELVVTLGSTFANTLIIFFLALINDLLSRRQHNYEMILLLWAVIFVCVYVMRLLITNASSRKIKSRSWRFPTLVVGCGSAALAYVNRLNAMRESLGYDVKGYVSIDGENAVKGLPLPVYSVDELPQVCEREHISELIVVPTKSNSEALLHTINRLFPLDLPIKMTPDRFDVLKSQVRLNDMYGDPLVDITSSKMGQCSKNLKRTIDVVASAVMLVLLSPLYLIVSILVKLDSSGPVFFLQERVGRHKKPFNIIKFRSMRADAEAAGVPQLSSEDDPRVTKLGRKLRKYRIDELPQFWNVLKGDMSLVGPRPERQFYVNLIQQRMPSYTLLHQVRPGITSLGMVKFGYARNIDEMVDRMGYDLLYLENMSLLNDLKIMAYTIQIVLKGRGM